MAMLLAHGSLCFIFIHRLFSTPFNGGVVTISRIRNSCRFYESCWLDREKKKSKNSICEGKAAI